MEYIPLNFGLMRAPINWVIVFLMVAFASYAMNLVFNADNAA